MRRRHAPKKEERQRVRQQTAPRSLRDSTCPFEWQLKIAAFRKGRLDIEVEIAMGMAWRWLGTFAASREAKRGARCHPSEE
jgi:hypothetical protein